MSPTPPHTPSRIEAASGRGSAVRRGPEAPLRTGRRRRSLGARLSAPIFAAAVSTAAFLASAFLVSAFPAAALAAPSEAPADSFRRASDSLGIQTGVESFERAVEDLGIQTGPEPIPRPDPISIDFAIPTPIIVALGVGALLIAAWPWLRNLRLPPGDEAAADNPDEAQAPSEIDQRELGRIRLAAESLALQGRFGEAVHALLLETIELIKAARRVTLPPSLTSREIAAGLGLEERAAEGLQTLVGKVEPTWFGLRETSEADWLECRAAHDRLTRALARRGVPEPPRGAWPAPVGTAPA